MQPWRILSTIRFSRNTQPDERALFYYSPFFHPRACAWQYNNRDRRIELIKFSPPFKPRPKAWTDLSLTHHRLLVNSLPPTHRPPMHTHFYRAHGSLDRERGRGSSFHTLFISQRHDGVLFRLRHRPEVSVLGSYWQEVINIHYSQKHGEQRVEPRA